jgi:hypothetical protein
MSKKIYKIPMITYPGIILQVVFAGLIVLSVVGGAVAQQQGVAQQTDVNPQTFFETPDQAVNALLEAAKNDDNEAMLNIFGHEYEYVINQSDRAGTRANRIQAYRSAQEMLTLRDEGNDKKILVIGKELWPMPIPLVKEEKGWRFNTEEGIEEILNRRIGLNELSAIEVCGYYLTGQKDFASRDRDGDQVLEYAQLIKSDEGAHNGLYWEAKEGEELSPFGPLVADAKEHLEGRNPGDPFKGYYFKILTQQGQDAPGGQYSYIINGNMIGGFAMIAFPADYSISGIMTFLISHHGTVYQKDLGPDTQSIAPVISEFNLDKTWTEVQD